jgi:hypothetical protein
VDLRRAAWPLSRAHPIFEGVDLIGIYLEDHLALSLGGIRLARRCLAENRGTELGRFLERLVAELEEDRAVLLDVVETLGGSRSVVKEAVVVIGELAGRLKPNGRLVAYSDLSRLWELEALLAGTESRRAVWKLLGKIARREPRLAGHLFEPLEERARQHTEELERHRVRAGELAFLPARVRPHGAGAPSPAR